MMGVSGLISSENPEGGGGGGGAGSGGSSEIGLGGGSGGFMTEEGERSSGGNRWPRQETIALLKIRSEMDVVFRDSSLKGPLWEEVSRKMADLGYHRSSKKCKEKFENVYKYHKRTKDGRASKADGKNYRFFEQLEALENITSHHSLMPQSNTRPPPPPLEATPINMAMPMATSNVQVSASQGTTTHHHHVTVSSAPPAPPPNNLFAPSHQNVPLSSPPPSQLSPQPAVNPINNIPPQQVNATNLPSHQNISAMSYSTSSSTSSDEDIQRRHKKKRKWKDYFEKFTKDVINKQEESHRRFLEKLEKREHDRMVREEAWKVQEMARMNREHDLLVQERAMAAAKDAAVISFLQKITEQQNIQIPNSINVAPPSAQVQIQLPENPLCAPTFTPAPTHSPQPHQQTQPTVTVSPPTPAPIPESLPIMIQAPVPALIQSLSLPLTPQVPPKNMELAPKSDNGGDSYSPASSSRWPKAEVEALIKLRTNLDVKYQENGPKGPLWEEISSGMRKIGYNRNAKRCKEKWENINKYFKKVKESNKKRPEDSKTCPYFHQLDALYKEKAKNPETTSSTSSFNPSFALNQENNPMAPIMARPEQQWPLPQDHHQQQHESNTRMDHENESDNMDEDDDDDEDDDEDEDNAYEIVANKQQSSMAAANTTTTTATTTV
ncbi:trihelix transcription factor DF1-like [Solanum dulcamara]|uniref:trihelix transcription factor DF1-like n=1 Tax=Solanum dulcamara TaxID=45834 RepID=UPI00248697C6|nr:trihelix transcription factor DF1-like [Solanum dulcamara]